MLALTCTWLALTYIALKVSFIVLQMTGIDFKNKRLVHDFKWLAHVKTCTVFCIGLILTCTWNLVTYTWLLIFFWGSRKHKHNILQQKVLYLCTYLVLKTVVLKTLHTLTTYALCKWGQFERSKSILLMLPVLWFESMY